MGKTLCLDYGRKRVGVAISDSLQMTAQPLDTWVDLRQSELIHRIQELIQKESVERIIIGYPLTLEGKRSKSTESVERWMRVLVNAVSIPVLQWDERLTSVQAQRILHLVNKKPSRNKEQVDVIASVLILQNFLDTQRNQSNPNSRNSIEI